MSSYNQLLNIDVKFLLLTGLTPSGTVLNPARLSRHRSKSASIHNSDHDFLASLACFGGGLVPSCLLQHLL